MKKKTDKQKLLVYMIAWDCCIRVIKEAYALKKRGYRIKIIARTVPSIAHDFFSPDEIHLYFSSGTIRESCFNKRYKIKSLVEFWRRLTFILKSSPRADIYHVHNDPSDLVSIVRRALPKARIVFDVHDLNFMRNGIKEKIEAEAFRDADAVIWVSDPYGKVASSSYAYYGPSISVSPAVPTDWYRQSTKSRGIVYQGNALTPEQVSRRPEMGYRDFTDLIKHLKKSGHDLHMFIANTGPEEYYRSIGAVIEKSLPYIDLLEHLSEFAWGLSLFKTDTDNMRFAMPNKIYDYIAAGIPVIGTKGTPSGDYIEKYGIGITTTEDTIEDIPDPFPYKKRVLEVRNELSMDKQAEKIEDLYYRILNQ